MMHTTFRERLIRALDTELSIAELARRSGYSARHIGAIVNGSRMNPTLAFVEAVAGAIGMDPLDMLKGEV